MIAVVARPARSRDLVMLPSNAKHRPLSKEGPSSRERAHKPAMTGYPRPGIFTLGPESGVWPLASWMVNLDGVVPAVLGAGSGPSSEWDHNEISCPRGVRLPVDVGVVQDR